MKQLRILLLVAAFTSAVSTFGQGGNGATSANERQAPEAQTAQPAQPPATIASVVDREITTLEKQIFDVAEAMPDDKFTSRRRP